LRWLERVYVPGVDTAPVTHQHLLRAMDALIAHQAALEAHLAGTLRALFDDEMEVVFYDITPVKGEGERKPAGELRRFGHSKEVNGTARQFTVGVVQTVDGLPILHEVFEGHVSEPGTVRGIVERLCRRFPLRRRVLVADRGMVSLENLATLEGIRLPGGKPVEYIVAVAARRYTRLTEVLAELHPTRVKEVKATGQEAVAEVPLDDETGLRRRLVVAHHREVAERTRHRRREKLRELSALAQHLEARLLAEEAGELKRGRPLTVQGAKMTLHHAVAEHKLGALIQVDQTLPLLVLEQAGLSPGLAARWPFDTSGRVLLTNLPAQALDARAVVARYKRLADIERGFRVLKSEIEIAPVYHRLPDRIRAHTLICFLARVIYRVMQGRLKANEVDLTPTRLLEQLKAVQYHQVRLATGKCLAGISTLTPEHKALFAAIDVPPPTLERLMKAV
jgi:transposase